MSEWIKTSDRFPPPDGEPVLAWNGRWDRVAHFMADSKGRMNFYSPRDDVLRGIIEWMPIPQHR